MMQQDARGRPCISCGRDLLDDRQDVTPYQFACVECLSAYPHLQAWFLRVGKLGERLPFSACHIFRRSLLLSIAASSVVFGLPTLFIGSLEFGVVYGVQLPIVCILVILPGIVLYAFGAAIAYSTPRPTIWISEGELHFEGSAAGHQCYRLDDCKWKHGKASESNLVRRVLLPVTPCLIVTNKVGGRQRKWVVPVGVSLEAKRAWEEFFEIARVASL